jgi:hypothetical protein
VLLVALLDSIRIRAGPVFCGCNLLRGVRWRANLDKALTQLVSRLRFSDEPGTEEDVRFGVELLNLLEWDEEGLDDEDLRRRSSTKEARKLSRLRLARFLKGSWISRMLIHCCTLGCCAGPADSRQKLKDVDRASPSSGRLVSPRFEFAQP